MQPVDYWVSLCGQPVPVIKKFIKIKKKMDSYSFPVKIMSLLYVTLLQCGDCAAMGHVIVVRELCDALHCPNSKL